MTAQLSGSTAHVGKRLYLFAMRASTCALSYLVCCVAHTSHASDSVQAILETSRGDIHIEVFVNKAPHSAASFLRYLDEGEFNGGAFHRVVRPDNDNGSPKITVIQGGVQDPSRVGPSDYIVHETTDQTGILHVDGTLSLARSHPGTASGAAFFICIDDQPSLDSGGRRNKDGHGFAAFGRVQSGMEIVRAINAIRDTRTVDDPYVKDQILSKPVRIIRAYRKP